MRMPPPTDELPDASYADAVFTVITKRAAIVTGLTAGAIVPCIPLAILGSLGLLATLLFNRGTIELGTSSAITPENVQVAAIVLLLVVLQQCLGRSDGNSTPLERTTRHNLEVARRFPLLHASRAADGSCFHRRTFGRRPYASWR